MPDSNDISEVIASRRTIHNFQGGNMPPEEKILTAIELAVCAPNHHATEPWRFYLIGSEAKEKICQLNAAMIGEVRGDKAAEIKLNRWREVPGWLLLTCDKSANEIRFMEDYAACCCAAQNLMLYLWGEGIGVKWTTGSVTREERFYKIMEIDPDSEFIVGLFWYGYPSDIPETDRKSVKNKLKKLS